MAHSIFRLDGDRQELLKESGRRRSRVCLPSHDEVLVDELGEGEVEILFVRINGIADAGIGSICLPLGDLHFMGSEWGWAGVLRQGNKEWTVWIPRGPRLIGTRGSAGRMVIGSVIKPGWTKTDQPSLECELRSGGADDSWSFPLFRISDPDKDHLRILLALSRRSWPHLMKSEWFRAESPSQVWDSLIDGAVFDPRPTRGGWGRFRCQQCAHAWRSYLRIAARVGSAPLLENLATELVWSVRAQYDEPEGWHHGFWCEPPETHLRFFFDGIDVLLDEAESSGDRTWLRTAERATEQAIRDYSDDLADSSLWFLHDSIEASGIGPRHRPPNLGQSSGNALVLNTHVQALTVLKKLHRLQEVPTSSCTDEIYQRGLKALHRVLELDSVPSVYRVLGACIRPAIESKGRSDWKARITRAFVFRALPRFYWWIRRRFPRLVYPNGFVERDMASSMFADDYHLLNLKDLLVLYTTDPQPWLRPTIEKALIFLGSLDLESALERSPFFIEADDIAALVSRAPSIEVPTDGFLTDSVVWRRRGAQSLDRYCLDNDV